MIRPGHWRAPPDTDPRTYLELSRRGTLAPGHRRGDCPRCLAWVPRAGDAPVVLRVAPVVAPAPAAARTPVEAATPPRPLHDVVLLTLARMPETRANVDALVVAVWRRDPAQFGLRGHEREYPDPRRLEATLDGPEGLVARGLCARPRPSVVRLTAAGRRAALGKAGAP